MYQLKIKKNHLISQVQQIVNAVVTDIEKKVFIPKTKLPAINQLSKENKISRDTVEKAYRQLKNEGYIVSVPGRGYFVLAPPKNLLTSCFLPTKQVHLMGLLMKVYC